MPPPDIALLLCVMMFILGALFVDFFRKERTRRVKLMGLAALGLAIAVSFFEYGRASEETCDVEGTWVRFYDVPDMCNYVAPDVLTRESGGVNGDPPSAKPSGFIIT